MRLAPCGHFHHTPALGGLTGPITPGGRDFGPGQDRGLVTGDWFFRKQKIRNRAELTYVTPLDGAFTKPVASARLGGPLAEKGVEPVSQQQRSAA